MPIEKINSLDELGNAVGKRVEIVDYPKDPRYAFLETYAGKTPGSLHLFLTQIPEKETSSNLCNIQVREIPEEQIAPSNSDGKIIYLGINFHQPREMITRICVPSDSRYEGFMSILLKNEGGSD